MVVNATTTLYWFLHPHNPSGPPSPPQVYPGEIVELGPDGVRSLDVVPRPKCSKPSSAAHGDPDHMDHEDILLGPPPAFCIFEYVYFARADSVFEGKFTLCLRHTDRSVWSSRTFAVCSFFVLLCTLYLIFIYLLIIHLSIYLSIIFLL